MKTASNATLDFSHVIRDRLTSIALCSNTLQSALASKLSSDQVHAFGIIQSSISDIKAILDQLAGHSRNEMIGAAITPNAPLTLPKAPPKTN